MITDRASRGALQFLTASLQHCPRHRVPLERGEPGAEARDEGVPGRQLVLQAWQVSNYPANI